MAETDKLSQFRKKFLDANDDKTHSICKVHTGRKVVKVCAGCFKSIYQDAATLRQALADMPHVIQGLCDQGDKLRNRVKELEQAFCELLEGGPKEAAMKVLENVLVLEDVKLPPKKEAEARDLSGVSNDDQTPNN